MNIRVNKNRTVSWKSHVGISPIFGAGKRSWVVNTTGRKVGINIRIATHDKQDKRGSYTSRGWGDGK